MRRTLTAAVLVSVFLLSLPGPAPELAPAQPDRSVVDEILGEVEEIRGLEAPPDVPVGFLSRRELEDKMLQEFHEEYPEEEVERDKEIMVMLGFAEEDVDLNRLYVDLYTEQVAGFYDPDEKSLYLISEEEEMDILDRYILAHELTHYLQDFNFDLTRPPFGDPEDAVEETDDDAAFAATCLLEGDAMITSEKWLFECVSLNDVINIDLEAEGYSTEVLDSAPYYIRDALLFPYEQGLAFVRRLHEEGGYAVVNEAFRDTPPSTEVILHPEKYLEGEEPVEVDLPDLTDELGEGWELAYEDVLGEFDVLELFKPYLSRRSAARAAEGWGGNTYHYYRDGEGGQLLVQGYAWDSEEDAREFSSAFLRYVDDRFEGDEEEMEGPGEGWYAWRAGDYLLAVKLEGINTYVVQATEEEPFEKAVSALGGGGEEIEGGILEETAGESTEKDYTVLVVAGVVGLMLVGLALIVVMLVLYKKPPAPPGGPYTGGTYGGPPSGGPPPGGSPGAPPPPPPPVPPSPPGRPPGGVEGGGPA